MKPRVAINGFGRIGRNVFRANLKNQTADIVAINDLGDLPTLAHLLEYDSIYGHLDADIRISGDKLVVNGQKISIYSEKDPLNLPWAEQNINVVVESTGFFCDREGASKHLLSGAKKVIVSAPGKDLDFTVVLGVNHDQYDPNKHNLISNASCTTNCLAPVAKVLHEKFGIEQGLMTTTHAYTNDQRILDLPHNDLRRARAAALSMIPTTTGAAKAVGLVLPELNGKLNGFSLRVPTPTVSVVDLVVTLEKPATAAEINSALRAAAEDSLKGILAYSEKPLVSVDYVGNPHSAIIDALSTMSIGKNMVKVVAWYDNEWGYSCRVVDLIAKL